MVEYNLEANNIKKEDDEEKAKKFISMTVGVPIGIEETADGLDDLLIEGIKDFTLIDTSEITLKTITKQEIDYHSVNFAYKIYKSDSKARIANMEVDHLVGTGWEMLTTSKNQPDTAIAAFKAIVLINRATKEIHFANAGTEVKHPSDLLDDALISFGYTTCKHESIKQLNKLVIEKLGGVDIAKEYSFSVSGHSLGGVLAACTGVDLLSYGFNIDRITAYDSPGAADVIKYAIRDNKFSNPITIPVAKIENLFTCYNARPNFINQSSPNIGDIFVVIPVVTTTNQKEEKIGVDSLLTNIKKNAVKIIDASGITTMIYKACEVTGINNLIETFQNDIPTHIMSNFIQKDAQYLITLAVKSASWRSGQVQLKNFDDVKNLIESGVESTGDMFVYEGIEGKYVYSAQDFSRSYKININKEDLYNLTEYDIIDYRADNEFFYDAKVSEDEVILDSNKNIELLNNIQDELIFELMLTSQEEVFYETLGIQNIEEIF